MLLVGLALSALAGVAAGASLKRLDTSLTILTRNDLQGPSSPYADQAAILTEPRSYHASRAICAELGEQLWKPSPPPRRKPRGDSTSLPFADYLKHEEKADALSKFWVSSDPRANAMDISGRYSLVSPNPHVRYPGLCSNTAPYSTEDFQDTGREWQISLDVNNQTLTGFRDRLSFRFLGVRYAPQPQRFTYSTVFRGSGEAASALSYGSQCVQGSEVGSEDCLFLNIWTPYLPNPNQPPSKRTLRPVAFWIHGGAFTGGTANDATFDGGNMASRGDVVVVAINYRLSTLGFLALRDGVTNGNFGLADQITALDWVRAHIHHFGGDPDRITVFGQSAGAASVRALLASPKAAGKFAGAIMLSNLGGLHYGTTYSRYYTIDEQVSVAANAVLEATNCTDAASKVDCLRAVPAHMLTGLSDPPRYLVVDGTYLTTRELHLGGGGAGGPGMQYPPVPLMMGITRDDGAPFISFPDNGTTAADWADYLAARGLPIPPAHLFPIVPGPAGNQTLDVFVAAARLATDAIFRCVGQATVHAGLTSGRLGSAIYYYEFDRTYQPGGWPELDVCEPESSPSRSPYLRCHSGELYYVFGTLRRMGRPPRDGGDLPFARFVLDSFVSFIRSGDPNPEPGYLRARPGGYHGGGRWLPSTRNKLTMRVLDWPRSRQEGFRDLEQCEALGLGLDYYVK